METKKYLFILMFCSLLLVFPSQGTAMSLMESFFLKITIVEKGIEHEWEYSSPGKYEYEKGTEVIKTKEAKDSMVAIIKTINLTEKTKVEDMVEALKKEHFPQLERLDIRWMNGENKLYTWVWEK